MVDTATWSISGHFEDGEMRIRADLSTSPRDEHVRGRFASTYMNRHLVVFLVLTDAPVPVNFPSEAAPMEQRQDFDQISLDLMELGERKTLYDRMKLVRRWMTYVRSDRVKKTDLIHMLEEHFYDTNRMMRPAIKTKSCRQ
jgi:hypothetical protein